MSTMMGSRILLPLLIVSVLVFDTAGETDGRDSTALKALVDIWENTPPNWTGFDPCGDHWDGIVCRGDRVTKITLLSMNLKGTLSGDIEYLSELQILDLSYNRGLTGSLPRSIGNLKKLTNLILLGCGFTGPIPDTIGSLPQLLILSLNMNGFNGQIPASIGNLSNLYWLDLADNRLTGTIPVSSGTNALGLDKLVGTKHFHFGSNQLSGTIPPKLFSSDMKLIHVLFESNQFSGPIPATLGEVKTLEVVRLDGNLLTDSVPPSLNNLTSVSELYLSNNQLSGPLPDLSGMNLLTYVDMSNNSFTPSNLPSSYSSLQYLTTLGMEDTQLEGKFPESLSSLPNLQNLRLGHNKFNSTFDISTTNSNQLNLIDMRNNSISAFADRSGGYDFQIILAGNPYCDGPNPNSKYCTIVVDDNVYSTPPNNCVPITCSLGHISSPSCKCAFPYNGTINFRATTFSDFGNSTYYTSLEKSLNDAFQRYELPVDSVSLSVNNPNKGSAEYLQISVSFFPSGQDSFNRTGVSDIGNLFSNQTYKPPREFGPYYFNGSTYVNFAGLQVPTGSHKSSSIGIIIGAAVGGTVLVILLVIAGVYAFRQKKRAETATQQSHPFANWDTTKGDGGVPQLKGARWFSFEELKKYTNNFSETNNIGSGGYGKVYRGVLPSGELIAIKRAQQGSMQGGVEFKTEIELLSRVHHKNLVSLYGFCFEQGEQILVYEYVPNGTLRESLSGTSGISMDWMRRLKITLGSARGLAYLHELADPPIIHRDIKTNNILLDDRLTAKVADFGLSKPMSDAEKDHVTTQVKGTMGYLDPEYYMTQQLTEKSDVYSFGVVMLELATARRPIERGRYIVREVRMVMDKTKHLSNLQEIIDPAIASSGPPLHGLEKYVDLAMKCVQESGGDRPSMSEVVKEIESIMHQAGLNPNVESASTSETYNGASMTNPQHPYSPKAFEYSGGFTTAQKIEPQ